MATPPNRRPLTHLFLLFSTLALLFPVSHADIFVWDNEEIQPNKLKVRSFIEMYTVEDSPMPFWSTSPPQEPSISVDLTFNTVEGKAPPAGAQLEIAVFKATHGVDEYTFRYDFGDSVATTSCCTDVAQLASNTEACKGPNSLYIDPTYARDIQRWQVKFDGQPSVRVQQKHVIQETGEHFLIIADCTPPALKAFGERGNVVNGHTEWVNPYGHLMGRLYGYLPFYAVMTLVFTAASAMWFSFQWYYRQSLASVQHCISVVLALCCIESLVWFVDYYMWNQSGSRNVPLIISGILLTVSRLSVSRMLVVAVSLGWGVVRPSLGKNKWRLIALGALYFLCETGLELIQRYSQIDATVEKWRIGLIIPVSVLNSIFYWWMFLSLHRLLVYLDARKQAVKLHIYRQLTVVLTASLILGVMYAAYQIHFTINQQQMVKWASLWLLDQGIPFMIYTLILLSIAVLWRPSAEGKQYQYSQLQVGEGDDEEAFDVEKNARGEAGDSEEDDKDAGLDVDEDEVTADQPQDDDDSHRPPPPKVRAQFSIGEEAEERPTKAAAPLPTAPLIAAPQAVAEGDAAKVGEAAKEVKVTVNEGGDAAAAAVKKVPVKAKKAKPAKK